MRNSLRDVFVHIYIYLIASRTSYVFGARGKGGGTGASLLRLERVEGCACHELSPVEQETVWGQKTQKENKKDVLGVSAVCVRVLIFNSELNFAFLFLFSYIQPENAMTHARLSGAIGAEASGGNPTVFFFGRTLVRKVSGAQDSGQMGLFLEYPIINMVGNLS